MYKQCQSERSAARQHELEQGLLTLMATRDYEDISVTDICERMGIPRKSFYRYFSGKDGALMALLDHTLMSYETYSARYYNSEKRTIQGELEGCFRFWIDQKQLLDVLERNRMTAVLIQRCIHSVLCNNALPFRMLPKVMQEDQESIVMFAISGLMALVIRWHHGGYVETVEQMAATAVHLLCTPLFPNVLEML